MNHTALIAKIRADMALYARLADANTGSQRAHFTAQFLAAQKKINAVQLLRDNTIHAA